MASRSANCVTAVLTSLICISPRPDGCPASLDPAVAQGRLLDVAAGVAGRGAPDPAVTGAVTLLRDPRALAEDVAAEVGLSLRQLRRRCHDAIGYGPKTLQRILRFRGFVSRIDRDRELADLAALAADAGYADQSHLTRECVALAGLTPAALVSQASGAPWSAGRAARGRPAGTAGCRRSRPTAGESGTGPRSSRRPPATGTGGPRPTA